MAQAQAVHERAREVERADVLEGVVADVEAREARVVPDEDGEGGGARRLERVAAEVEGRERGARHEHRGEGLDAAVVQGVEAEVEVLQGVERSEPGLEHAHAAEAHVVGAEVEGRDGRARAQGARDGVDAVGAQVAVAGDAEVQQLGAGLQHGDEAERGARAAVQGDAREAGAGRDREEALQDDGPLGGARRARVREPPELAHADRGGQALGVDGRAHGLADGAQEVRVVVLPVLAPDVVGDAGEEGLEGLGVEHLRGRWKWQQAEGLQAARERSSAASKCF